MYFPPWSIGSTSAFGPQSPGFESHLLLNSVFMHVAIFVAVHGNVYIRAYFCTLYAVFWPFPMQKLNQIDIFHTVRCMHSLQELPRKKSLNCRAKIILHSVVFHLSQNYVSVAVFRLRDSPLSHFVTRETLEVSTAIQPIYVFSACLVPKVKAIRYTSIHFLPCHRFP